MANVHQPIGLNSPSISDLAYIAISKGGEGVNDLVKRSIASYKVMGSILHQAACASLFHAAETGDSRPLTMFWEGLRQNDQDALRLWVGKLTKVTVLHAASEAVEASETTPAIEAQPEREEVVKFMGFKKDKGFSIEKKTENYRKGYHTLEALLAGPSFQDVDQAKETKAFGLVELLAMLARVEGQVTKKAEENDITIPANLLMAVKDLTKTVATVQVVATKQ